MDLIAEQADLYSDVWRSIPEYATMSPGERYLPLCLDMLGLVTGHGLTALDAGCGSGKGSQALIAAGFLVTMTDLTDAGVLPDLRHVPFRPACLWHDLAAYIPEAPFDLVYCCDVLEHLPTAFTMLAVARLLAVARRGVFLSIAHQPDEFGVLVGRPLHQTVESFSWWKQHLGTFATVRDCRDLQTSGLFHVVAA